MRELRSLQAALDGELLTPDSPAYDAARRPALTRFRDVRPQAVVRCASVDDVARVIVFARHTGTRVVPRGGGHCFAGRSSTEGVLCDLSRLDAVTHGNDGRVSIGAGARLARVYDGLHKHARTLPAGCGPTVGIAGLTLGGGLGLLGRVHGLTCDALISAQVVVADGTVVDCDYDHEPDLFWALRGAGGGQFGVVTSLTFATVPEPRATRFELRWPEEAAIEVVEAWQDWAPVAPDDMTANLTVAAEPGGRASVVIFGAGLRDAEAIRVILGDLIARVSAQARWCGDIMGWRDLKRSFAPQDPDSPVTTSRSEFFAHTMPRSTIAALIDELLTGPSFGPRELHFTAMGGAYNRAGEGATAFAHRNERFLLEHVGRDDDPWVTRSWALVHPHASGRVYPNFPDPALDDWATAYHGGNLERLRAVKRAYDPDRLLRFPQAL